MIICFKKTYIDWRSSAVMLGRSHATTSDSSVKETIGLPKQELLTPQPLTPFAIAELNYGGATGGGAASAGHSGSCRQPVIGCVARALLPSLAPKYKQRASMASAGDIIPSWFKSAAIALKPSCSTPKKL